MRRILVLASILTLSACSKPAEQRANEPMSMAIAPPPGMARVMEEQAAATDAAAPAAPAPQPSVPVGAPMLAYSYAYAISAPPGSVRGLVSRHEAACAAAGAAVCQVVGSSVSEQGEDRVSGTLTLRATPAWLKRFREGLAGEAKAAGGRLVQASVDSEDLSRQIVDTEAQLRAKSTLRDRLQALLASRPGKLSDLLEVERELARVQAEIDAARSMLEVMRARVATSELQIRYESEGVLAPEGVWSPLADAFGDFLSLTAGALAAMVRIVAVALPWALLVGGLLWLFRKRLPRFRRKTPPPPPAA